MITKWCFDTENEPISQHLKRRGKLTFDDGDKSFTQNDLEDININNSWFLQDAESVKNVPGHDPGSTSNKSNVKNIREEERNAPLSPVDSNYAFENSINGRPTSGDFVGHDFNSFQEMINHGFHQNIPTTFQAATETNANVKEANDIQTLSNIDISAARQTLANIAIGRTVNEEGETSSSSRLRVIFPDTKEDSASGNKKDNDRDTPADNDDTGPVIEKVSVKTNIQELTRQPLQWSGQGDHSGFLGQQDTTIASRLEQERTMETDKHSFHFNDEELQTETFKGRVYTVYIFIFQMVP